MTLYPALSNSYALDKPANPAPITIILLSSVELGKIDGEDKENKDVTTPDLLINERLVILFFLTYTIYQYSSKKANFRYERGLEFIIK
tara:strand:+ start:661 stop:924 length:264 start_codon:yes stop_codon:yes gene_type:complete